MSAKKKQKPQDEAKGIATLRTSVLLGEQRLDKIKQQAAEYGYTLPMTKSEASRLRDCGEKTVEALIELGLVKLSEIELPGLSTRAKYCLMNMNIENKIQAKAAMLNGTLKPGQPRNYGWDTHNEVGIWCGLGPQTKQKRGLLCPYCGKDTLCPPNVELNHGGE